jgi:hypothetical protein
MAPPRRNSPCYDKSAAPARIASMPSAIRRSKFSRKANQASKAVKTPSRLRRREAPDAQVRERPSISSSGAIMPPVMMAPASQGRSVRVNGVSLSLLWERVSTQ